MSARSILRRDFLASSLLAAGAAVFGPALWRGLAAAGAPAQPGNGPYGPLQEPDENGLMLPAGFTSRVIAISGVPVLGSTYVWHIFPDGGATYATPDGGWIYVSNSEVPQIGGCGAVRFTKDGDIADAYSILSGTSTNCAGGPTPWGTWLSCEETDSGRVWECDPSGERPAEVRPAMGSFSHEAAAV
ncbi:MAG TPA: alkaline phosphatase PhoX, partial [Actinomycetota bacterium]|nr:alkaline phosphatase PhoX [Actinomycetota bacterium]